MARRIREYNWVATPLGPIEAWPQALRTAVEMVLASPLISSLVCGPDRVLIYNDAAARLYGARHPAALAGKRRVLKPYFTVNGSSGLLGGIGAFPEARTAWVSFPDRYRARCRSEGGATWLHADALGGAADERPVLAYAPTPGWGLHLWDVNIALGNLVALVKRESAAWLRRR